MTEHKDCSGELVMSTQLNQHQHSDIIIESIMQDHLSSWLKKQLLSPGSILKLGYGNEIITDLLVSLNYPMTIVESSQKLSDEINLKYQNKCHIIHDLYENYEAKEPFDYILACFVLEFVDNPTAILKRYAKFLFQMER